MTEPCTTHHLAGNGACIYCGTQVTTRPLVTMNTAPTESTGIRVQRFEGASGEPRYRVVRPSERRPVLVWVPHNANHWLASMRLDVWTLARCRVFLDEDHFEWDVIGPKEHGMHSPPPLANGTCAALLGAQVAAEDACERLLREAIKVFERGERG